MSIINKKIILLGSVKEITNTNQFLLVLALCLPVTIACIDLMALSVAIDNIIDDFSSDILTTQWLLSGYTIGTASFLITIGNLSDTYGRRRFLLLGVFLFGISSLIASISSYINILIACRFAQGIASSIMMTTVISIITNHFSRDIRAKMISKWAFSLGIGMSLGPLVGGILLQLLNWRAIFAINIPICFISYYLIQNYIPESKNEILKLQNDWPGTFLLTSTMLLLMIILSQGARWGWSSNNTLGLTALFAILTILLFLINAKNQYSLIDFSLFFLPNFSIATICGFASYFCMYGWLFAFSLYLQNSYNLTPLKTGFVLSSFSIGFAVSSNLIGRLSGILENKNLINIGFILGCLLFLYMTTIHDKTNGLSPLILTFFLLGIAITFVNAASMIIATHDVPTNKSGIASGLIFTIRWLGGSIGVAIITIVYQLGLSTACFLLSMISCLGFLFSLKLKKIK